MDSKRYDPLEIRQIFYENLLLIGFQPSQMELKYKTPFNKDMFALPNKKAMEVVLYFLFENYDHAMTEIAFRDCWPVIDKQREQQFRKTCVRLLSEIAEKEPNANLPRIMASALLNPTGDRFYSFLNRFSLLVMRKLMANKFGKSLGLPQLPKINPEKAALANSMKNILLAQQIRYKDKFCELSSETVEVQNKWKEFALTLTKKYRKTNKTIREIEKEISAINSLIKNKKGKSSSPFHENRKYDQDTTAILRTESLHKVRDLWTRMNNFYSGLQSQREVVNAAVEGNLRQKELNGNDIPLKIPDMLLRKYRKDIQSSDTGNTLEGGKVNLLSLVYLWNLSLHFLKEDLSQEKFPDLEKLSKIAMNLNHRHQQILRNSKELRSLLTSSVIPEVKTSINVAGSRITSNEADVGRVPGNYITPKKTNMTLGLIPPSPAVSFSNSQAKPLAKIHAAKEQESTPYVIRTLSHKMKADHNANTKKDIPIIEEKNTATKNSNYSIDNKVDRNNPKSSNKTNILHPNNGKSGIPKQIKKTKNSHSNKPNTLETYDDLASKIVSTVTDDKLVTTPSLERSLGLKLKTAKTEKRTEETGDGNLYDLKEDKTVISADHSKTNPSDDGAQGRISFLTLLESNATSENTDNPMLSSENWNNLSEQLRKFRVNKAETTSEIVANADYLDSQITSLSNNSSDNDHIIESPLQPSNSLDKHDENNDNINNIKSTGKSEIDVEVSQAIQAALRDLNTYSSSNSSDELSVIKDNYAAEEKDNESELDCDEDQYDTKDYRPAESDISNEYKDLQREVDEENNFDDLHIEYLDKITPSDLDDAKQNTGIELSKEHYTTGDIISFDINLSNSDIYSGSECGSPGLPELIEIPEVSARKPANVFGSRLADIKKGDSAFPKFDLKLDDVAMNEQEDNWLLSDGKLH
ncbi:HAUS augmin-like complex subunit 6 [Trichoplax sp. H2]|nr:HAUS augmin-like complex subunit 6 [Trichoplax sp. H2]|eukprot:RDD46285.1 HAUS augmin-like complex subunit 6 [Trichoplax sp. H2]